MDGDKPSTQIQVIDTRTGTEFKVACMSCIRGHRTLSCGAHSCRSKVFWTIRRAGRPQGSCTCARINGVCRCSRARVTCIHKAKKGESKRGPTCRCDEQGRYCCLLEPQNWDAWSSGDKMRTKFFPNREALLVSTSGPSGSMFTNSPFGIQTSGPSTPLSPFSESNMQTPSAETQTPVPRFGFMGVNAPQGNHSVPGQDELAWHGAAPLAPRDYQPFSSPPPAPRPSLLSLEPSPSTHAHPYLAPSQHQQDASEQFGPVTASFGDMSVVQQQQIPDSTQYSQLPLLYLPQFPDTAMHSQGESTQALDTSVEENVAPTLSNSGLDIGLDLGFNDLMTTPSPFGNASSMAAYNSYQFPSAICQQCGFAECSCTNCPTLLQSYSNTSWAHGCHKAHTQPPAQALESASQSKGCCGSKKKRTPQLQQSTMSAPAFVSPPQQDVGCCGTGQTTHQHLQQPFGMLLQPSLQPDFDLSTSDTQPGIDAYLQRLSALQDGSGAQEAGAASHLQPNPNLQHQFDAQQRPPDLQNPADWPREVLNDLVDDGIITSEERDR